ncbi:MAG: hypothetical protein AAF654_13795 [Myxococcota bacterium]
MSIFKQLTPLALVLALSANIAYSADSPPWQGSWRYSGGAQEDSARAKTIETATEDLSFLYRGKARDRLTERLTPAPRMSLTQTGDEVTLQRSGTSIALKLGGPPIRKSGENGGGSLSARLSGDALVLLAKGEKGRRTTTFKRKGDSLIVTVSLDVDIFDKPLTVQSTYTLVR